MNIADLAFLLVEEEEETKIEYFLQYLCDNFGCRWYHIVYYAGERGKDDFVEIGNYPSHLKYEAIRGLGLAADPACGNPHAFEGAIHWREANPGISRKSTAELTRLYQHWGMRDGVSIHFRGPGVGTGFFAVASGADLEEDLVKKISETMKFLSPHLVKCADRLFKARIKNCLSRRECEVLYWVAFGKTSWEISKILRISERTINFHIAKCIDKLDAANRSHAAVKAVQIGAITI